MVSCKFAFVFALVVASALAFPAEEPEKKEEEAKVEPEKKEEEVKVEPEKTEPEKKEVVLSGIPTIGWTSHLAAPVVTPYTSLLTPWASPIYPHLAAPVTYTSGGLWL